MTNLEWFAILNKKLTNEEYNMFVKKVSEAGLTDKIFKKFPANYKDLIQDFLDGKYKIVPVEIDE